MSHILKLGKIHGASVIFHPFKFSKTQNKWYPSPHFHLVGFGKSSDIKNAFGRYGWYVKEAGERDSVFQTFCYLTQNANSLMNFFPTLYLRAFLSSILITREKLTCSVDLEIFFD